MDYSIIIRPLIGAGIGYITNWIAVKMMFRPLHPIKIGKFTLPFTPGIIPKNQPKLAESIGNTIASSLLTDNDLKEVYCKNDFSILDPYDFESITDDSAFNSVYFNYKTSNVKCNKLRYCGFNNQLIDNTFGDIDNTIFNQEVKGTTIDYIIRTSNVYYQYNLSKITDSYIGTIKQELVFTGEIINSSIETIQNLVQLLGIIENSKILNIPINMFETDIFERYPEIKKNPKPQVSGNLLPPPLGEVAARRADGEGCGSFETPLSHGFRRASSPKGRAKQSKRAYCENSTLFLIEN